VYEPIGVDVSKVVVRPSREPSVTQLTFEIASGRNPDPVVPVVAAPAASAATNDRRVDAAIASDNAVRTKNSLFGLACTLVNILLAG
jgi:hypothetical protein